MKGKEYTSFKALSELRSEGHIDQFLKKVFDHKQYWLVEWHGETTSSTAAVGATLYRDGVLSVPFGIQKELLRQGKVSEVVLVCKAWNHFYRIPAVSFRQYSMTEKEGRLLFQISRYGSLRSGVTLQPINLDTTYRIARDAPREKSK